MKSLKYLLAVLLILVLVAGCSSEEPKVSQEVKEKEIEQEETKEEEPEKPEEKKGTQVDNKLIFDKEGIKITLVGQGDSGTERFRRPSVDLEIENTRDEDIKLYVLNASINDLMVVPFALYGKIFQSGEKIIHEMDLIIGDIESQELFEDFGRVDLQLAAKYSDNEEDIFPRQDISFMLSDYEGSVDFGDWGRVIYDDDDLKIGLDYLITEDSDLGTHGMIFIENKAEDDYYVETHSVLIDGEEVSAMVYTSVAAGKKDYTILMLDEEYFESHKLDDVKSMEFDLTITIFSKEGDFIPYKNTGLLRFK